MMSKKYISRRTRKSLIVLFVLAFVMHFLDSRGYLHGLQMALGLDPMLQVAAPGTPTDIGIVQITDDDYRNYFCGQSPLDGRGVLALVLAVREKLHPAVIGVDLDTSDWKSRNIPTPCPKLDKLRCAHPKKNGDNADDQDCMDEAVDRLVTENYPTTVVWAQIPRDLYAEGSLKWWQWLMHPLKLLKVFWTGEREDSEIFQLQTVAGRSVCSIGWGIPRFPLDLDGAVRKYRRHIDFDPPVCPDKPKPQDSLPHALARACESCVRDNPPWQEEERHKSSEDLILKFFTNISNFNPQNAGDLLPPLPDGTSPRPSQAEDTRHRPSQVEIDEALSMRPLRIVLIGGTYKGARDIYRTPLGEMPGVQLLAQALQTDLHESISETGEFKKFFVDILAGLAVIFLWSETVSRYVSVKKVFWLSLVGIPFGFVLTSLYLFHHRIWLDTIAITVGVVLHQVYEEFDKIKEYKEEIERKTCTIAGLKKRLEEL
jgi:CHASE2 domain